MTQTATPNYKNYMAELEKARNETRIGKREKNHRRIWHRIVEAGIHSGCKQEYKFDNPTDGRKKRQWRFDFAWPARKVAIEVQGATFGPVVKCGNCQQYVSRVTKTGKKVMVREGGHHSRGPGMSDDAEKLNTAAEQGWVVLLAADRQISSGDVVEQVKSILPQRPMFAIDPSEQLEFK